ncbi:hypothetical protein ACLQ25_27165 [Micromonospora sp. DT44]|uniref:hypothetical protein n=1 Tax=Micromonospora sp. DT44 TaxID=3393439 RepID=UPI003CF884CE
MPWDQHSGSQSSLPPEPAPAVGRHGWVAPTAAMPSPAAEQPPVPWQPTPSAYAPPPVEPSPTTRDSPGAAPISDPETRRIWASLRSSALSRVGLMNTMHGRHAWAQRRRNPLCPYGFAFLYAVPVIGSTPDRMVFEVGAATRLDKAGEDVSHLPRLLYDLAQTARHYLDNGGLDPRQPPQMCNRVDERITAESTFIGLAVSSLDGPLGTWEQTMRRVEGEDRIPGRFYIQMMDPEETRIVVDRPTDPWERPLIQSTTPLYESWRPLQSYSGDAPIWTGIAQFATLVHLGAQRISPTRGATP